MALTLEPAHQDIGADAIRARTLGLSVVRGHPACAQLALGYSDTTIASMRNDSAISRTDLDRVMHNRDQPKEN